MTKNHFWVAVLLPVFTACTAIAPPPTQQPSPTLASPAVTIIAATAAPPAATVLPTVAAPQPGTIDPTATQLSAILQPTETALAQATTAPLATVAPAGPQFVQLTKGGCCVQPFFMPDGAHVVYLDRPQGSAGVGYYGVPVAQPLAEPRLMIDRLGPFSRDLSHRSVLVNGQTFVERIADGQRWAINNGGRSVSFSPDATRLIWSVSNESGGFDRRKSDVFLANIDGSAARKIITRYGGGPVAWFNDGQRILIGGRAEVRAEFPTLAILDLNSGAVRDLFTGERWRGVVLSPDNKHLVYFVAQARAKDIGGTFLLNLENPQPVKLDFFGGYRWRDATRLLYVPLNSKTPSNELWQLDVTSGASAKLIEGAPESPFKIGNGDWDISSDGSVLTWLNARDRNIWITRLNP